MKLDQEQSGPIKHLEEVNVISGDLSGEGKSFVIAVSRFNQAITEKLLEGALQGLKEHQADMRRVDVVWCPGAFELASVCQTALAQKKYDGVIALGVVIRGETPHFDYVCQAATEGISRLSLAMQIPIAFGVLTTDNEEQARARASDQDNKGYDAALCALEMASLKEKIKK